jgi:V8-like Glu-specific endopeptidase
VIPGRRGAHRPYGSATTSALRSVQGWTQNQDSDFDYGAILLPEANRYGDQLGWFGYSTRTDEELESGVVNLSGYPGDKPSGTQWFHSLAVDSHTERKFKYQIDTFGGQSGAPVWQLRSDGGRYGVGIHTSGHISGNSATRITRGVFDNIVGWIGQAP